MAARATEPTALYIACLASSICADWELVAAQRAFRAQVLVFETCGLAAIESAATKG